MESADRKKKNKKGDDDDRYTGRKEGYGDGRMVSLENDFRIVDNVEGKKKKRKKDKEKGSDKERDENLAEMEIGDGVQISENGEVLREQGESKKKKKKKKEKGSNKERGENLAEMEIGGDGVQNSENGEVLGVEGESKKKKKKKKERSGKERDECLSSGVVVEDRTDRGSTDGKDGGKGEGISEHGVVGLKAESKKRKKEKDTNGWKDGKKGSVQGSGKHGEGLDVDVTDKIDKKKLKLKKGKNKKDLGEMRIPDAICVEQDTEKEARKKKRKREKEMTVDDSTGVIVTGENLDKEVLQDVGRKRRKTGNGKNNKLANDLVSCEGSSTIEKEMKEININNKGKGKQMKQSENTKAKKGKKKVSFSGQVEVFPVPSDSSNQERVDEQDKLVRGKRFSAKEDKIIQEAVYNYIEERGLGEEGLNMVLNCKAHPEVKGCWKVIGEALPHRPSTAVYFRAHNLFERTDKSKWTDEDCELLRQLHAQHGNKWKRIAGEFGRERLQVKDVWRRLKVLNKKGGQWSQEEYQALFDLVNTDLRLKIIEDEEKKQKYGMLRDNIHWSAISDALTTRTGPNCCMKWYMLSSPMVEQGLWLDSDDHRLIDALFTLDASCIEDVDWDNLLGHRSGDICRDRWNQMVLHIGNHMCKSFSEQIEILTKRYCPDLIEVREEWENKPFVDVC